MNSLLDVADLFCGAGGTSTGLLTAAKKLKIPIKLVAVNHWDLAISTHSKNHPDVTHYNSDLNEIDPRQVVRSGKLRLLVASPECTHFSKARGGKPMSKQSRASVKYVVRWIRELDVEDVLIENVPDFMTWGPLHRCSCGMGNKPNLVHAAGCKFGLPVQSRKGEFFRSLIRLLKKLGYQVDYRVLNAADYGDPTTRKRLFIIARKKKAIEWPEPSHHKNGGDMFGKLPRWRAAREIIDWTVKGESIFNRRKSLSPNTMRRIMAGLQKFGGKAFVLGQQSGSVPRNVDQPIPTVAGAGAISLIQPFLITTNWSETNRSRPRPLDEPIPAITGQGAIGIVQPFIIQMEQGGRLCDVDKPMPTITSADGWAVVDPYLVEFHGGPGNERRTVSLNAPLPTQTAANRFGLAEPFLVEYYGTGQTASVDEPMKTLTGRDHFGLVEPLVIEQEGNLYMLDIRFRMLQPHELARAMSFPKKYKFSGNREQVVKQIGNSVPVGLSEALCGSLLQ